MSALSASLVRVYLNSLNKRSFGSNTVDTFLSFHDFFFYICNSFEKFVFYSMLNLCLSHTDFMFIFLYHKNNWLGFFFFLDTPCISPSQNKLLLFSCYLAVPGSSYLPVLWQFLSSPISPFMQISHLHKGIPMAVNSSSFALPVL